MREILLYEGESSDPALDKVLPGLISKAIEAEQDMFVRWNGVTMRVEPMSTVKELMAEYEAESSAMHRRGAPKDGRDKTLYRIKNGLGIFYVVSRSFDEAAQLLQRRLEAAEYGSFSLREIQSIEVIAVEQYFHDKQNFSGDNDKLIVED